jgi:hypothetical protein
MVFSVESAITQIVKDISKYTKSLLSLKCSAHTAVLSSQTTNCGPKTKMLIHELLLQRRAKSMYLERSTKCTPRNPGIEQPGQARAPQKNAGQAGQAALGFVRFVGESTSVQPPVSRLWVLFLENKKEFLWLH